MENYGFDGIAVALVGNSAAGGTALAGLLFGMLKSAQPLMQSRQIPKEITSIIMGLVVVFISLRAGVKLIIEWQMKEKTRRSQNELSAAEEKN
jgi:simple sugar transport system permease protein